MKFIKKLGQTCAILGSQWGDEGKGKLVDILAEEYDVIMRGTGGANAGHTIYNKGEKTVFHLVPSGMLHENKVCLMGNGMVIHFPTLFEEIDHLKKWGTSVFGRLFISSRAHIVFEYHKVIDKLQEERKAGKKVGTTLRGIGPAYSDKINRNGIRVLELADFENFKTRYLANLEALKKMHDFVFDPAEELSFFKKHQKTIIGMTRETSYLLAGFLEKKKTVLFEGANGTLLDIDHGTYPYVTSSNASVGGLIAGCGLPSKNLKSVIGILKAYVTRVGEGPFPTELKDELGEKIRAQGNEYGATTGRPRRCGWFDAVLAKYSALINGFTAFNLTKLDVLTGIPKLKIAVSYKYRGRDIHEFPSSLEALSEVKPNYIELAGWDGDISSAKKISDLSKNARKYVETIEKLVGVKMMFIGVGRNRDEMIYR